MFEMKTKRSRSWLYTGIGLLLVVALLASIFSAPVQAAKEVVECKTGHQVRSGDTLAKIATKYGVYVKSIVAANNLGSPVTIYVGNVLCIPAKGVKDSKVPGYANNPAANFTTYVQNDKLFIQATNFPENNSFYVKVQGDKHPGTVQNKIGVLNTGERSNFKDVFKLPKVYSSSNKFTVCLKNVYTDALVCRTALR